MPADASLPTPTATSWQQCIAATSCVFLARPTADQILASPMAAKWLRVVPAPRRPSEAGLGPVRAPSSEDGSAPLLDTILVPRDIRQLPKVLPPPSYDTDGSAAATPSPAAAPAGRPGLPPASGPSPRVSATGGPAPSAGGAQARPPLAPTPHAALGGGGGVPRSSANGGLPVGALSRAPVPTPVVNSVMARRRMSDNGGAPVAPPRAPSPGAIPGQPGPLPTKVSAGLQLPPIDQRMSRAEHDRASPAALLGGGVRPPARRVTCS
jgi:NIMA (never in mitosis gene a)-related kinase